MKLIFRYLKPFLIPAAISIALLFAQNIADLFLPRYMSQIVDIGIMQGGVTEAIPAAMSARAMEELSKYADLAGAYEHTTTAPSDFPDFDTARDWVVAADAETQQKYFREYTKAVIAVRAIQAGSPIPEISENDWVINGLQYTQTGAQFSRDLYAEIGANKHTIQQRSILQTGLIMLAITLFTALITVLNGFLTAKISTGIGRHLRHDVFTKVQSFSPSEFDHFSTATLITRCTNDVQQVQMVAMMGLRMVFSAPIMGVGGIVMAVNTSATLSWIVVVAVILLLLLQVVIFGKAIPKFEIMQKLQDKLNLVTRETLTGMMVIRAFGNEERELGRFEEANREIRDTNRFVQRLFAIMQPTMNFIMGGTTLVVIFLGSQLVAANNLQVGQMMAFMQYVMQIIMSFLMIGMMFMMIPRALVSAKRIQEVLGKDTSIHDKPEGELQTLGGRAIGELAFNNVSFKYQDAEACVLENISFTAKSGETIAFIGSTGSGKSTLINLIPRFYDVTDGSITLDGVDIRDISVHELRNNLGYVPQKGILFSGNIESNLNFGKEDATVEEYRESVKVAQAEDFVYADKDGLRTEIAQSGDNVSGGQKQRLSIARALVKKPPIYIFDDSFSALDFKTDAALRRALREYTGSGSATVLIVAQRISTIMNAHQIIVLDAGKIVGKGTHAELLKTCEEYREIAESQLSKEELQ
ncbi:MAG: ABC transporter ATP-binding protein/permease [Oscillospiraceae bacterium]|jgi:ATP-binding cassette subfamily B protein|nr:ABC transporter ATP-binding protein/permease [Oscillospiraceae bacterium]